MVRIRLRRVGAKKQPSYRIVVADARSPRNGRFIETIGHYNPRTDPPTVVVKEDRALHWLSQGAQPSDAVAHMLGNLGVLEKLQRVKAGASIEEVLAPPPLAPPPLYGGGVGVGAEAEEASEAQALTEAEAQAEVTEVEEPIERLLEES